MSTDIQIPPLEEIWWQILLIGTTKIHFKEEKLETSDLPDEIQQFLKQTFLVSFERPFKEFDGALKSAFPEDGASVKKTLFANQSLFQLSWQGSSKEQKKNAENITRYLEDALKWKETRNMADDASAISEILGQLPLSKEFPRLQAHLRERIEVLESKVISIETLLNSIKSFLPSKVSITPFLEWVTSSSLVLNKCNQQLQALLGSLSPFFDEPRMWVEIREVIGDYFKVNKLPKLFDREEAFTQVYDTAKKVSIPRADQQVFIVQALYDTLAEPFTGQEDLLCEMIYMLYLAGIFVFSELQPPLSKSRKKELKDALETHLLPYYIKLVEYLFPNNTPPEVTMADVRRILPEALNAERQELEVHPEEQPVQETIQAFSTGVEKLTRKIDALDAFLTKYQYLVGSRVKTVSPLSKMNRYMMEDLKRKEGEYADYVNSVENETQKGELQEKISEHIAALEASQKTYEEKTAALLQEKFHQIQEIEDELAVFEDTYLSGLDSVTELVNRYGGEKSIDIYSVLKHWETFLVDFQKKVKMSTTNLFASLAERFKPILEKEREFLEKMGEIYVGADASAEELTRWMNPQHLTLTENRDRIQVLDEKLRDLDALRGKYLQERVMLEQYIADSIQSQEHIETKQCVVCHKVINFGEDQFIKCPECSRAAHYLCLAWWLEKHNNCVVCGAEFVVPDNVLFPVAEDGTTEDDLLDPFKGE
ncbi:MAG TPA: hypothetical protein VKK79_02735 [Candidatus Lokiarchaeia archaeon]|nr:hypothetical protein [Candidatus Lokiarchaeia archaeon]